MSIAGYAVGRRGQGTPDGVRSVSVPPGVERNRSESRLPEETQRILRLLRSEWMVVDPSDRVIARSDSADLLGVIRGTEIRHEEIRDLVRESRHDGGPLEADLDLLRGPGADVRVDLDVRVAPLTQDLVLVLMEDQTQARRIDETRRDFVVNVSHELKTPVGGLRLLAEAVEDAADDADAVGRFASRMKIETVRLANLVQEIVDFSRLQGEDTLAAARPVDIADCARRAVDETRLIAENKGIELRYAADGGPHDVMGDTNLLTTAIRNLVNNAVNYSDADTRVQVEVCRKGDRVIVQVADQGIGMSAEDTQRIFERFYRVDQARSRRTGGTGLGLAIVKHVVSNHGGQMRVWSEIGVGSTFDMELPAIVDDGDFLASEPGAASEFDPPVSHDPVSPKEDL